MAFPLSNVASTSGISGMRGMRGFTLVELIVTFMVLAIIATAAAPSFSALITSQRVRGAAGDLASSVTLLRSEAAKRNATVTMTTAGTASNWADGWVISAGTERVRAYSAYNGIQITSASGNTLSIGNDGRPTGGSIAFQVAPPTGSSSTLCVQVSGTGRVNTVSGACT